MEEVHKSAALFTNDAVVLGILIVLLAAIFYTSSLKTKFWSRFYRIIPALLLCYFLPSVLNSLGLISGDDSSLYFVASRYLLPASLVLLCLSIDIKGILRLGPKAIIMFFAGTLGIVFGGPIAILAVSYFAPDIVGGAGPDEVWRGLATVAGSWIGGGANQTAMKEIYGASDELFSAMITVDVIVANIWMAFLLIGAGMSKKVDKVFKADASAITQVKESIQDYRASISRTATLTDIMVILAIGLGGTAIAHFGSDIITPIMKNHEAALTKYRLTS
ncbi:MAG TPA: DUF819 family protein, partial [Flavobacteriaceae bacterium]|nr:DUF819 family protein [Flavobacteriaceae bacterium]